MEDLVLHGSLETTCPQGTLGRELSSGPKDSVEARPGWSSCILQLQNAIDISVPQYTPKIEEVRPLEGDNKDKDPDDVDDEDDHSLPVRGRGRGRGRGTRGGGKQQAGARPVDYTRKRRTLGLVFTDGRYQMQALEFDPLVEFDGELLPGMKFRLQPPVQVRRGVLLLTFGSIQRLGGFLPAPKDPAPPKPSGFALASAQGSLPALFSSPSSSLPSVSLPSHLPPVLPPTVLATSPIVSPSASTAVAPFSFPRSLATQSHVKTVDLSPLAALPSLPTSDDPSKLIVIDDDEINYDDYDCDDEIYLELTET